jgi:hypothetical protein
MIGRVPLYAVEERPVFFKFFFLLQECRRQREDVWRLVCLLPLALIIWLRATGMDRCYDVYDF